MLQNIALLMDTVTVTVKILLLHTFFPGVPSKAILGQSYPNLQARWNGRVWVSLLRRRYLRLRLQRRLRGHQGIETMTNNLPW